MLEPGACRRRRSQLDALDQAQVRGRELSTAFAGIPVFVGLTGLRCSEWLALERRDVDRAAGVVHVRRVFTDRKLKLYGKPGSLRTVPLPQRAAESLLGVPPRLDTPLLFPGARGGYLNVHEWRRDEWAPAIRAAGLEHRRPYALRHTFASFSIAAGVPLFELSRFMGTSVTQIEKAYGHLLPDSLERARTALRPGPKGGKRCD
jgi:integrase